MMRFKITSDEYWVKIVDFLQHNWAVIEPNGDCDGYVICFFGDTSGIFDYINYKDIVTAKRELRMNGFEVYTEEKYDFIGKPRDEFHERAHPNGKIYSSGRYWKSLNKV